MNATHSKTPVAADLRRRTPLNSIAYALQRPRHCSVRYTQHPQFIALIARKAFPIVLCVPPILPVRTITRIQGFTNQPQHLISADPSSNPPEPAFGISRRIFCGEHPRKGQQEKTEPQGNYADDDHQSPHIPPSRYPAFERRSTPVHKVHPIRSPLELGSWNFLGAWCLEIGQCGAFPCNHVTLVTM